MGLDIQSRAEILATIRDLVATDGISVFWATHLIDEVESNDDVVVLDKGRVLAQGRVSDVVRSVGSDNIRQAFASLTGLVPVLPEGAFL